MASFIASFIPQAAGLLPKWQLFISTVAFLNSVQNFTTLKFTRRVYSAKPHEVTPLQARMFGVWTLLSAVVRFYAAYHINEKSVYDITLWSPLIVSSVSTIWMYSQYDFYVKA
ncbi:ERG28 family protein [Abortiporus biennis]